MAWVSVYQQIANHRKTRDLFRKLKISRPEAIGHLVLIWLWAIDNADRDGCLLSTTINDIEEAGYWTGECGVLYKALVDSGWIDEKSGCIYLHDWGEFNKPFYQYIDRKEKDKLRKREGKSAGNSTDFPGEFRDSPSPSPYQDIYILNNNTGIDVDDQNSFFGIAISLEQYQQLKAKAPNPKESALWLNHHICEFKRMKSEGLQCGNDFQELLKIIEEEGKQNGGK